jgi:hypothetical protein
MSEEFSIKPEKGNVTLDTSDWPLLLKVKYLFIYKLTQLFLFSNRFLQ